MMIVAPESVRLTVMRHRKSAWISCFGAAALLGSPACAPAAYAAEHNPDAVSSDVVSSQWQHHKVKFNYVGFTTLYTCDGLETHVRQILMHLGARKDVHVAATGCPGPGDRPSRTAWVDTDFYALAPADASQPDAVQARWTTLSVTPQRPSFMGEGDCELVQEMKPLITENFTLRNVDYRTDCFPREITLNGFSVTGQALRPLPLSANAVKS
jgi:hypothetical protein